MRVEIDEYGIIYTYNDNNNRHSFNGKPAEIRSNGYMAWYDNGRLLKMQWGHTAQSIDVYYG